MKKLLTFLLLIGAWHGLAHATYPIVQYVQSTTTYQGAGSAFNVSTGTVLNGFSEGGTAFPATNGTNGQCLVTNGSGSASWASCVNQATSTVILNQSTNQSGAVFNVSSGTVSGQFTAGTIIGNLNASNIVSGTVGTTYLPSGIIYSTNTLQSLGTQFYVSSGTILGQLVAGGSIYPTSAGAASQCLVANGSGVASWGSCAQASTSTVILLQSSLQTGATFYVAAGFIQKQFGWEGDAYYRPPNLVWISTNALTIQTGQDGTAIDAPVLFPDGRILTSTSPLCQVAYASNTWSSSGQGLGGMATSTATVNTWYSFYAVENSANNNWVLVGSTNNPVQANFSALNTLFGTNEWKYIGMARYGDQGNTSTGFLSFIQSGERTWFTNQCTASTFSNGKLAGMLLSGTTGTTLAWQYASGISGQVMPSNLTGALFQAYGQGGGNINYANYAGTIYYSHAQLSSGSVALSAQWEAPASVGLSASQQGSTELNATLAGFIDNALSGGNNPMF